MILYSDDTSPYCAPVRAAIYAKQLPIPIEPPPGELRSEAYRQLSGTGTIPCLMLDDGSPLPESAVILAYLDDKFPQNPLRPADAEGRARVGLLLRLADGGLVGALVQFFHDRAEGVTDAGAKGLERLATGLDRAEFFVADAGYAAGPDFSLADCVLGPALFGVRAMSGMMGDPGLLDRFPKVAAYAGRAAQHPAIAKVLGELSAALAASSLAQG